MGRYAGVPSRPVVSLFLKSSRLDALENGFDELRVKLPQKSADVLNLPAPGPVTFYAACELDVLHNFLWQSHGLKPGGLQGHQLFPQSLQCLVFFLFLGSAFIRCFHIYAALTLVVRRVSSFARQDFSTIQLILRLNSCSNKIPRITVLLQTDSNDQALFRLLYPGPIEKKP